MNNLRDKIVKLMSDYRLWEMDTAATADDILALPEIADLQKKPEAGGKAVSDLVKRLTIKAGVMEMGETIAWGSDTALMREAADRIEELEAKLSDMALDALAADGQAADAYAAQLAAEAQLEKVTADAAHDKQVYYDAKQVIDQHKDNYKKRAATYREAIPRAYQMGLDVAATCAKDDYGDFTLWGEDRNTAVSQATAEDAARAIRKLTPPDDLVEQVMNTPTKKAADLVERVKGTDHE